MSRAALILLVLALMVAVASLGSVHASTSNLAYPGDRLAGPLSFDSHIGGLEWAPNGSIIALTLKEKEKLVLASPEGEIIREELLAYAGGPVAWSPNGSLLAVGSGSRILLYSPYDYQRVEFYTESNVLSIAWISSGNQLAVGLENGSIIFYDIEKGTSWRYDSNSSAAVTAMSWWQTGNLLVMGDNLGRVKILNLSTLELISELEAGNTPITCLKVNPLYDVAAYSTDTSTFLARIEGGNLNVYAQVPHGTLGSISWSPDGEWLVIPSGDYAVIVGLDGKSIGKIYPRDIYPYTHASWDPTDYSRIAFAGYNDASLKSGLEVIYSGAIVEVQASYPVINACYESTCGNRIVFSPQERRVNLILTVVAESPGEGARLVDVILTLDVKPLEKLTYDAFTLLTDPLMDKHLIVDESLNIILCDPTVSLKIASSYGEYQLSSRIILLGAGDYALTLYFNRPSNYLGPDEALEALSKTMRITSKPGEVTVYDYTWFKLEKLIATLQVSAPPNSTVTLYYSGRPYEAVTRGEGEAFLVPTGSLKVILTLPSTRTLVDSPSVLSRSFDAKLYPGDVFSISFTYSEILGKLFVRGPVGATVTITPPWSNPYNPVNYTYTLAQDSVEYWALPGTYKVEAKLAFPDNYLGHTPTPVAVIANVTKGRTSYVDFYSQKDFAEALSQYAQSAHLTVESKPGYVLIVERGNTSYRFNLSNNTVSLIAPPGEYVLSILDPSTNTIVNTKRILVEGPGNITLSLQAAVPTETSSVVIPSTPQPTQGSSNTRVAILLIIPVIVGLLGYFLLRRLRERMSPL